ncbi:acetamidase/formamidase family protein [Brevibacillus borstelensis]|uniref:formamidase n=1 Tax=Brevibacillus borstelensis TaxID=45462 RepID=UPI00046A5DAC|nr:formamidase [Brevibacillus borstelensis]MCC0566876.1 acetamidase/formamidase family protein [Brevibacillus borstelensis]MCM3561366.1 acetamidase/formamidase family protein [Brevibacillus borstelensis]MCM3594061.1 acetamidase/formamidase family protein [Brevibacillus borstelensis]MED1852161.1 acetamidase/formamidase family protein [Brevibacillus borstelensis]
MPEVLFKVDLTKPMEEQDLPGHNRWHPDIPAVAAVNPGAMFRIECKDWTDGQIQNNDDPSDIRDVNLKRVHVLSGPIWVNGAEPGDLLVVDILDIGPLQGAEWGFAGIFARENGGGFLTEHYPEAAKSIWDFHGIYTTSRHIPGVRFAGITHPGLIGVAPSHELLAKWNKRERELVATDPHRVPELATLPDPTSTVLGSLTGAEYERIAAEGARTVPPRENGGNCDIKNLSRGSRIYFPVFVKGAKLSMGDIHFSQGDGEISFCGGIEMAGFIDLHVDIIKGGMAKYGIVNNPVFKPGPVEPHYSEFLVFEGISVDEFSGKQHYLDAHLAYRRACLNAIEYLKTLGYTGEQAYMLLSTAPVEGRISGIVDIPNACCTLAIPMAIFDRDITPK